MNIITSCSALTVITASVWVLGINFETELYKVQHANFEHSLSKQEMSK